jgi:hypothetical protein
MKYKKGKLKKYLSVTYDSISVIKNDSQCFIAKPTKFNQTQPVGFGRPANRQPCFAGPYGKREYR